MLRLPLFDMERLARQDEDEEQAERRKAQKETIAARMKAVGTASIME